MKKSSRLQSAMEYLMTYGWAILIIAVVLGALFQLGVFNASSFSPRAPPGACQVFRPSGPGTVTNINLMGVCTGQLPQYVAQFNGANSYADMGNIGTLNGAPKLTISLWIKPNSLTVLNSVIAKFLTSTSQGVVIETGLAGNADGLLLGIQNNGVDAYGTLSHVIQAGVWAHIVLVYDGTQTGNINRLKGYVNGVLTSFSSFQGTIPATTDSTTAPLQLAQFPDGTRRFNSLIADVHIYNVSLSANEVQALYIEGLGGAPLVLQNLVGWWPLNGDAKDYSGNNNNGVPTAVTFTSQYGK